MSVFEEECRDERRVSWFYDFYQDVRYGVRMMRRHPGFTAVAAISLTLAIGGNTAILSIGSALLWGELALPHSERLVMIQTFPSPNALQKMPASFPEYIAWKERNRTFESMGASIANQQDFSPDHIGAAPERLFGQAVTPSLFDVLEVQPQLGRTFRDEEARAGVPASPVIILSHRLWERRFGADQEILGKRHSNGWTEPRQ
jgi:hypothetical protein